MVAVTRLRRAKITSIVLDVEERNLKFLLNVLEVYTIKYEVLCSYETMLKSKVRSRTPTT